MPKTNSTIGTNEAPTADNVVRADVPSTPPRDMLTSSEAAMLTAEGKTVSPNDIVGQGAFTDTDRANYEHAARERFASMVERNELRFPVEGSVTLKRDENLTVPGAWVAVEVFVPANPGIEPSMIRAQETI